MMSVIIGRVSEYEGSNVVVGGKVLFVPPEKRNSASNNFPVGSVAKVTVDKGSAVSIMPPTEQEMAAFTRNEMPGNKPAAAVVAPVHPVSREPIQAPITPPAASSQAVKDAIQQTKDALEKDMPEQVQPGTVISVTIGGTLNLGNYNNVKMEVVATSAEAARAAYQQEIQATVQMMQGIIKRVRV